MPQMAPMNWILMSLSFILILLMILSLIHSLFFSDKTNNIPSINLEHPKWKW